VIFVARRVGLLAVRAEPAIPLIGFLVPNPVVAAPPHPVRRIPAGSGRLGHVEAKNPAIEYL
jgi:hypothetical protein